MRGHDGEGRQDLQVLLEDEVELAAIHRIQPETDAEGVEHRILRRVGLFDRRNCEVEQFFVDYRHRVLGPIFRLSPALAACTSPSGLVFTYALKHRQR